MQLGGYWSILLLKWHKKAPIEQVRGDAPGTTQCGGIGNLKSTGTDACLIFVMFYDQINAEAISFSCSMKNLDLSNPGRLMYLAASF